MKVDSIPMAHFISESAAAYFYHVDPAIDALRGTITRLQEDHVSIDRIDSGYDSGETRLLLLRENFKLGHLSIGISLCPKKHYDSLHIYQERVT